MNQWFERHVQTLVGSLGRLWQQPFATMLTIVVIGIALALPACLHVLVQNVRVASGGWNSALDISVYMKPNATLDQAKRAAERIRQRRDIGRAVHRSQFRHLADADGHRLAVMDFIRLER